MVEVRRLIHEWAHLWDGITFWFKARIITVLGLGNRDWDLITVRSPSPRLVRALGMEAKLHLF